MQRCGRMGGERDGEEGALLLRIKVYFFSSLSLSLSPFQLPRVGEE